MAAPTSPTTRDDLYACAPCAREWHTDIKESAKPFAKAVAKAEIKVEADEAEAGSGNGAEAAILALQSDFEHRFRVIDLNLRILNTYANQQPPESACQPAVIRMSLLDWVAGGVIGCVLGYIVCTACVRHAL